MPQADPAVKDEVVQDSTVAAPAPAEENKPDDGSNEQVADKDVMEQSLDELSGEEETEDEDEVTPPASDETKPETQPQSEEKPLSPKSENRFQKLANDNRDLKAELDRLKSQEAQIATEQDLLNEVNPETGDYYTPQEIERIAFAQSRETQAQAVAQERYNLEVQQNQQTIASEAAQALEQYPIFDEKSPEYNPDLTAQADEMLRQSLIVQDGVLVGSTLSPLQIYKTIAEATKANSAVYKAEAQKATEKMLANADVPSGATQATSKKTDLDLEAFDEEAKVR